MCSEYAKEYDILFNADNVEVYNQSELFVELI